MQTFYNLLNRFMITKCWIAIELRKEFLYKNEIILSHSDFDILRILKRKVSRLKTISLNLLKLDICKYLRKLILLMLKIKEQEIKLFIAERN